MSPLAFQYLAAWVRLHELVNPIEEGSIEYDLHIDKMDDLWYSLSSEEIDEVENWILDLQKDE
jgi:hypothetical protein